MREFTRGDSSQVSVQIDRLVPKTHDIRVDVYKNTLHSYNRIYQSPWQTVTIRPGQTTAVNWSPATRLCRDRRLYRRSSPSSCPNHC